MEITEATYDRTIRISIHDYYTVSAYERGKLFMHGEKIKKFIAYDEPSD